MPNVLPEKFAFSHDFALFLNDILSDVVKTSEAVGLFNTPIALKNAEEARALEALPDDQKSKWLEANGYGDANAEAIYKQVTIALLTDFCHFVFEGLNASQKGRPIKGEGANFRSSHSVWAI